MRKSALVFLMALSSVAGFVAPVAANQVAPPVVATGNGGPGALGGYALFVPFCAAGGLIVRSAVVGHTEHRELTSNEALGTLATCIFPPLLLLNLVNHH